MFALPPQLFFNTGIPACLWFLTKDKKNNKFRDRRGKTLFIDARKMGTMIDRRHRILTDDDIKKISGTYHAWRGEKEGYEDIKGYCRSVELEDVRQQNWVLTPGRYVGTEEQEEDMEKFEEKMKRLTSELYKQFERSKELEEEIIENLKKMGFKE